jgi:hypothetical protein
MVNIGICHKCDAEVNSMKLIHTEHRSNKVGFTINALLCEKCFLQEHSPERLGDS